MLPLLSSEIQNLNWSLPGSDPVVYVLSFLSLLGRHLHPTATSWQASRLAKAAGPVSDRRKRYPWFPLVESPHSRQDSSVIRSSQFAPDAPDSRLPVSALASKSGSSSQCPFNQWLSNRPSLRKSPRNREDPSKSRSHQFRRTSSRASQEGSSRLSKYQILGTASAVMATFSSISPGGLVGVRPSTHQSRLWSAHFRITTHDIYHRTL